MQRTGQIFRAEKHKESQSQGPQRSLNISHVRIFKKTHMVSVNPTMYRKALAIFQCFLNNTAMADVPNLFDYVQLTHHVQFVVIVL